MTHRKPSFTHFLFALVLFFFFSCQKNIDKPAPQEELSTSANSNNNKGHLQQTKTFSSELVLKWMDMQLRVIQSTTGMPPATNSRLFAYSGVALYESVVPGMPSYQTLHGQLNNLPTMPSAENGKAYHWAAAANAALASVSKQFFPATSSANKTSIDSLENALNNVYKTEVNTSTFDRSVDFGKAVAQLVFQWSTTDGSATVWPAYTPPIGPGLWVSTPPNLPAASTPYWGRNRLFVTGSLTNSDPALPPSYSTNPSSAYYNMMKEVYDISLTLTGSQESQAFYYRDPTGLASGGHYLSILHQLLQNEQPSLDFCALAFAKSGIAMADALIGCFQWKYKDVNGGPVTNTERPITYIRGVLGHTNWNAKFNTPPHPDFPSGHSTTAGAAEVIFTICLAKIIRSSITRMIIWICQHNHILPLAIWQNRSACQEYMQEFIHDMFAR